MDLVDKKKPLNTRQPVPFVGSAVKARNPKVELMRLKMKVTGNAALPANCRLYLRLYSTKEALNEIDGGGGIPIYVDKEWSAGKLLDHCASLLGVVNRNNELPAQDHPERVVMTVFRNRIDGELHQVELSSSDLKLMRDGDSVCLRLR